MIKTRLMFSLYQHLILNSITVYIVKPGYSVSEPTTPIPPPFEDSYKVNYNDGISGDCTDPESTAKPCPGQDKVNFHFQHCNSLALWHGSGT